MYLYAHFCMYALMGTGVTTHVHVEAQGRCQESYWIIILSYPIRLDLLVKDKAHQSGYTQQPRLDSHLLYNIQIKHLSCYK